MSVPNPATTDWVPLWAAGPVAGYVPAASLRRTADQAIPTVTLTALSPDATPAWDTDTMSSTGGRLTCKTAGYYLVNCRIRWAASNAGLVRNLIVFLHTAAGDTRIIDDGKTPNASVAADHNCSVVVYMNVGEYIYPAAYHDAGSNLNVLGGLGANNAAAWSFSATYYGPNVALGAVIPPIYGTSLPASPADGQEAILVDSLTNPTYQWRFRYNAGSASAYKWEFIGGSPAISIVDNSGSTTSASYAALSGPAGPQITLPRAGDYIIRHGAHVWSANTGIYLQMSFDVGATPASDSWSAAILMPPGITGNLGIAIAKERLFTGLAASTALVCKYYAGGGNNFNAAYRWMSAQPARVS